MADIDINRRIDELKTKQQKAGLTGNERAELAALKDRLEHPKRETIVVRPEQVRARRSGREAGEKIARLIKDELQALQLDDGSGSAKDPRVIDSFWLALREAFPEQMIHPRERDILPMTSSGALDWEAKTEMPGWSKSFPHQPIERVPLPYLEAVAGHTSDDEFKKQLRRYLASSVRPKDDVDE